MIPQDPNVQRSTNDPFGVQLGARGITTRQLAGAPVGFPLVGTNIHVSHEENLQLMNCPGAAEAEGARMNGAFRALSLCMQCCNRSFSIFSLRNVFNLGVHERKATRPGLRTGNSHCCIPAWVRFCSCEETLPRVIPFVTLEGIVYKHCMQARSVRAAAGGSPKN